MDPPEDHETAPADVGAHRPRSLDALQRTASWTSDVTKRVFSPSAKLASPTSLPTSLPTDFRLQLQVLERVSHHGQLLQRVADQQSSALSQLASLAQQAKTAEERVHRQLAEHLEAYRIEVDELRRNQKDGFAAMEWSKKRNVGPTVGITEGGTTPSSRSPAICVTAPLLNICSPKSAMHQETGQTLRRGASGESIGARPSEECSLPMSSEHSQAPGGDGKGYDDFRGGADFLSNGLSNGQTVVEEQFGRAFCRKLIASVYFESVCAAVICVNASTIGLTAERQIVTALQPSANSPTGMDELLQNMPFVFSMYYTMESALKLFALRIEFFTCADWKWNVFDLILVTTALTEILTNLAGGDFGGQNMTWLRVLRLLKMLKMLRVVRVMRFFRELRMMLSSIVGSIGTLMWSMLMLSLLTFVFGLCFLNAVTAYLEDTPHEEITEETMILIEEYWNSVFQSTVTLYMAVTGGADWEVLAKPIRETGIFYFLLFLFYIAFSMVAVLNVLTGLFVDTALKVAEVDNHDVTEELADRDAPHVQKLRDHLRGFDKHGQNMVSWENLRQAVKSAPAKSFMKAIEIGPQDMKRVFKMLRDQKAHETCVDIDEFIMGCSKIKGDQQGFDMMALIADTKRYMAQMSYFMECTEERFLEMHKVFQSLGAEGSIVVPLGERLARNKLLPQSWSQFSVEGLRSISRASSCG